MCPSRIWPGKMVAWVLAAIVVEVVGFEDDNNNENCEALEAMYRDW